MVRKHSLGQYFTTCDELKEKVFEFILNKPSTILEPSIGRGDLVEWIVRQNSTVVFDMYEIDRTIPLLDGIQRSNVTYGDFLSATISKTYETIIGNPPYVRTRRGNLYLDFVQKCYSILDDNGELIFIVPFDFFRLTSASKLLTEMLTCGTFTHIFHPDDEHLFEDASINVCIFRYCKNPLLDKKVMYNGTPRFLTNTNGFVTFTSARNIHDLKIVDCFEIYVGLVSGKESVFKHAELGNVCVTNGKDIVERYIFIDKFPCEDERINWHLWQHKQELLERRIRKFDETNWFSWGAPRNISTILAHFGQDCIYVHTLSRKPEIAFLGKVGYFGGGLLMLIPKRACVLSTVVSHLNDMAFKSNFNFSGRFKIGQRQLCNSYLPNDILND